MLGMEKKNEFYIGYVDELGPRTKKLLKKFVFGALGALLIGGFLFAFFQKPASTSAFDFDTPTKISGTYFEAPYPMLRVELAENTYKSVLLLGFGKLGANPYLDDIKKKEGKLNGKHLAVEGNLIYYNGKTLLQIDDSQKISLNQEKGETTIEINSLGKMEITGEIVDPKCYFGVMKPGYGKIHRSCAALCIAGGIPPVLVSSEGTSPSPYFLLTDLKGTPLHKDILPYIGQPLKLAGEAYKIGDWYSLRIDVSKAQKLNRESRIY